MGGEPTGTTEEVGLRMTIGPLTMPAAAACLAGIRGVDVDHPHACQRRLIGNEGAELKEGPTVQYSPLALPNRSLRACRPFSDVRQVFQRNPARSALRRLHNRLRETMVHVFGKTLLASAAFSEQPFRALRPFLLELLPEAALAGAHLIHMAVLRPSRVVEKLTIARSRQLDDV